MNVEKFRTISFFSLFIRVKEGGGVLGVLRKLIIRGKNYFLQIYNFSVIVKFFIF